MSYNESLTYLSQAIPGWEALVHDLAEQLRECKREVETRLGSGNGNLAVEMEVKSGNVTEAFLDRPKLRYSRRSK